MATGIRPVRVPAGSGLVGACARERRIINVPDCYADPRFDPSVDKASGYRTRCMLTLPLVDHKDALVGVMQVLNKRDGVFDAYDEALATALAAQCAVALQRVQMTECADRRREDAPGAGDGACRADEHAADRRCRLVPATTCAARSSPPT